MAFEMPLDQIKNLRMLLRKEANLSWYESDKEQTLPLLKLPSVAETIAKLDPSPPYLRCKNCNRRLIHDLQSSMCIFCGTNPHTDLTPEPIKFKTTTVYRWLLESLQLDGTQAVSDEHQPLSKVAIHKTTLALDECAYIKASPNVLGLKGQNTEWVTLQYSNPKPTIDDWIGVFSLANFWCFSCSAENIHVNPPLLCSAPIKYQYANFSSIGYKKTGKGSLKLQLINQRSDFLFALFTGGLTNVLITLRTSPATFLFCKKVFVHLYTTSHR